MGNYYQTTWRTYANFSLTGQDLDPAEASSIFQIEPSDSFRAGDLRKNGTRWKHGHWSLESKDHLESDELSAHIEWLLDRLEPSQAYIASLQAANIRSRIFCYWELKSGSGGPSFTPALLSRLVVLNVELDIDFYCNCD